MNRWLLGGLAGIFAGVGAYLMMSTQEPTPFAENVLQPPSIATTRSSTSIAPVVLAQVVETTDLDPLLDPPEKAPTGVLFDGDAAIAPVSAPSAPALPDRIPPAVEDKNNEDELSFFGYKLRSDLPDDSSIKTVFIHSFKFSSPQSTPDNGIGEDITEELARQIAQKTPFQVISDSGKADTTLIGRIVSIQKTIQLDAEQIGKNVPIQKNIQNVTQERSVQRRCEIVVTVEVVWRDVRNGKILSAPRSERNPETASTNSPLDATDPGVIPPADKSETNDPRPVRIVASGRYCSELGETTATAFQRAEIDLAAQVVSMMEKRK